MLLPGQKLADISNVQYNSLKKAFVRLGLVQEKRSEQSDHGDFVGESSKNMSERASERMYISILRRPTLKTKNFRQFNFGHLIFGQKLSGISLIERSLSYYFGVLKLGHKNFGQTLGEISIFCSDILFRWFLCLMLFVYSTI